MRLYLLILFLVMVVTALGSLATQQETENGEKIESRLFNKFPSKRDPPSNSKITKKPITKPSTGISSNGANSDQIQGWLSRLKSIALQSTALHEDIAKQIALPKTDCQGMAKAKCTSLDWMCEWKGFVGYGAPGKGKSLGAKGKCIDRRVVTVRPIAKQKIECRNAREASSCWSSKNNCRWSNGIRGFVDGFCLDYGVSVTNKLPPKSDCSWLIHTACESKAGCTWSWTTNKCMKFGYNVGGPPKGPPPKKDCQGMTKAKCTSLDWKCEWKGVVGYGAGKGKSRGAKGKCIDRSVATVRPIAPPKKDCQGMTKATCTSLDWKCEWKGFVGYGAGKGKSLGAKGKCINRGVVTVRPTLPPKSDCSWLIHSACESKAGCTWSWKANKCIKFGYNVGGPPKGPSLVWCSGISSAVECQTYQECSWRVAGYTTKGPTWICGRKDVIKNK